jgi:hypothetical protein
MKLSWSKALGGFFLAALLAAPAAAKTALPGTLNFVEGQASIESQPVTPKSVGQADVVAGQTITTGNGRAEVLLTPGVFLRLDKNSAVKMISPELTNTQVELEKGNAEIEVAELHKQNDLQVKDGDGNVQLVKTGLYGFSAEPSTVQVFKGEARAQLGDDNVKVKGGRQLDLEATSSKPKAEKFDKKDAENDFYNWSKLRSEYLSESSANAAQIYVANGWTGPGWYWDPYFTGYTFIPGSGMLYSPFGGWGFYSPAYLYSYGYYGVPVYPGRRIYGATPYRYHGPGQGFHHFHSAAPPVHTGVPNVGGFHGGFHGAVRR